MITWTYLEQHASTSLGQALFAGAPTNWSAEELTIESALGHKIVLKGAFTPNGGFAPVEGTINAFEVYSPSGKKVIEADGYSMNLLHFNLAVFTAKAIGDGEPVLNLLFGDALTIIGSKGDDSLVGGLTSAVIKAGGGSDYIQGSDGKDEILGGDGNDLINGNTGKDVIKGGRGDDELWGGEGRDVLSGGEGRDSFVFFDQFKPNSHDTIADFRPGLDRLHVSNATFKGLGPDGTLVAKYFHEGAGPKNGNDRLIYNDDNGALFYDRDGTGDQYAKIKIAVLANTPDLSHHDFLII